MCVCDVCVLVEGEGFELGATPVQRNSSVDLRGVCRTHWMTFLLLLFDGQTRCVLDSRFVGLHGLNNDACCEKPAIALCEGIFSGFVLGFLRTALGSNARLSGVGVAWRGGCLGWPLFCFAMYCTYIRSTVSSCGMCSSVRTVNRTVAPETILEREGQWLEL